MLSLTFDKKEQLLLLKNGSAGNNSSSMEPKEPTPPKNPSRGPWPKSWPPATKGLLNHHLLIY